MAEWSCIDERGWMKRRRWVRKVVQIMVNKYRDAQIDSAEVLALAGC
jgi:hypothetical protein